MSPSSRPASGSPFRRPFLDSPLPYVPGPESGKQRPSCPVPIMSEVTKELLELVWGTKSSPGLSDTIFCRWTQGTGTGLTVPAALPGLRESARDAPLASSTPAPPPRVPGAWPQYPRSRHLGTHVLSRYPGLVSTSAPALLVPSLFPCIRAWYPSFSRSSIRALSLCRPLVPGPQPPPLRSPHSVPVPAFGPSTTHSSSPWGTRTLSLYWSLIPVPLALAPSGLRTQFWYPDLVTVTWLLHLKYPPPR